LSWDHPLPSDQPSEFPYPAVALPPEKTKFVLPAVLLFCTFVTSLTAGFMWHVRFVSQTPGEMAGRITGVLTNPMDLLNGLPFAFTILIILLAHEMGHYLACRYYGIKATLPYVIPGPPPFNPFGTFGAVIKIKSLFADRRQLFDVGIAGPLGGFIFIIPALIIGLQQSTELIFTGPMQHTLEFGEPLLFRLVASIFFPAGPDAIIRLHPIGWAAWFGMLATSINLLPIGQLDGGHIVYALFGTRVHRIISYISFGALVGISLYSWPMMGYLLFAFILLFLRFRHPSPRTEFPPLGMGRKIIALIGFIIFVLTFVPVPVRMIEHVGRL
jgi:membrane-associated protease RseP (regulator of RpoE activity)